MNAEAGQKHKAAGKQEPVKKVAFVLSGGANRGALEVGVLLALMEHDILPQILVGTSVGAVNAAILAINPTLEGARHLEELWREASDKIVVRRDYISAMWRLVTGRSSLYDSNKLKELLESFFPQDIRQFSDIKAAELYITAVDINSGELYVFGLARSQSILDAIMASCCAAHHFYALAIRRPQLRGWRRGQRLADAGGRGCGRNGALRHRYRASTVRQTNTQGYIACRGTDDRCCGQPSVGKRV